MVVGGSRVGLRCNLSRGDAKKIQRSRWAWWKNPADLNGEPAGEAGLDRHQQPPTAPRLPAQKGPAIHATLEHGVSNGLIESVNTKIRLITRIAFGFKDPDALIALAMPTLGGYRPPPNRPKLTHGTGRRASYPQGGKSIRREGGSLICSPA
jgi:hypothetical protein